jgi:hypothetical protein
VSTFEEWKIGLELREWEYLFNHLPGRKREKRPFCVPLSQMKPRNGDTGYVRWLAELRETDLEEYRRVRNL